jgi:hypothetical protein
MFRREPKVRGSARKPSQKPKRSRFEVERQRRILVEIVIVVTIVAALALVGYGYYDARIKPWHQSIVQVNNRTFDMEYYVKMLRLWGVGGSDNPYDLASSVGGVIVDYELLREKASPEFAVEISQEEVDARMRSYFGFDSNTQSLEDFYAQLQSGLAQLGLSWSDLEEMLIEPMLLQEGIQRAIGDADYPSGVPAEQVRVQAMLVTASDNATAAREQWAAGADFDQLTTDFSSSTSYGKSSAGSEGEWMPRGMGEATFDDFAFGEGSGDKFGLISDPIEDSEQAGKFWLIRVSGKEVTPLSQDDRDVLVSRAYRDWLESERTAEGNVIVNYLDGDSGFEKVYWALQHLSVG